MAYDSEQWLTGNADSPIEDINATANGTARDLGANRLFRCELRVGGAVTGTDPTLDVTVQDSADNVTFTNRATFPQQTATMAGYQDTVSNDPEYTVPGTGPAVIALRTVNRYVRIVKTVGGTDPVFNDVTVMTIPILEH